MPPTASILGDDIQLILLSTVRVFSARTGASVHWYNKGEARKARKVGHINITGTSIAEVEARLQLIVPERRLPSRAPWVGIIMGSDSDLPIMRPAAGRACVGQHVRRTGAGTHRCGTPFVTARGLQRFW